MSSFPTLLLSDEEDSRTVCERIEQLCCWFIGNVACGRVNFKICMVKRSSSNAIEDSVSGAVLLGDEVTSRTLSARSAKSISQLFQVLQQVHLLLRERRRISQRELYYLLIESFSCQEQLNGVVLDASAVLGVPRYALNIGAATRGVVAGCLRIATANSLYHVDCEYVGSNGWPIPGDVRAVCSVVVDSTARYIIVIEKFGIFTRLVQDKFYKRLPCILICGKGYPSIATRALTSVLETRLRLGVLGLADFNPHGLALLQCYRRGSVRSSIEGCRFVCNIRWLGLRARHIRQNRQIGLCGEPLTANDQRLLAGMQRSNSLIRGDERYVHEIEQMQVLGKYELQWLYGHADGIGYLSDTFLLNAILRADYI